MCVCPYVCAGVPPGLVDAFGQCGIIVDDALDDLLHGFVLHTPASGQLLLVQCEFPSARR